MKHAGSPDDKSAIRAKDTIAMLPYAVEETKNESKAARIAEIDRSVDRVVLSCPDSIGVLYAAFGRVSSFGQLASSNSAGLR